MDKQKEEQLIQAALVGVKNAMTGTNQPEDMRFGAAVLTKNGNIYSSGSYYSDGLSLTLHSEQAALAHAAAHGEYEIVAIACGGNAKAEQFSSPVYPCHMCKQLLWESYLRNKEEIEVIMISSTGNIIERVKISDMINYPWPQK